jgi:hypothetical protein
VPRPVAAALAGLVTGLVAGLAMGFSLGPVVGLAYAVTFGPAVGFAHVYGHPRKPSRVEIKFRGHGRSLFRRLAASLAVALVTGHPISGIVVMAALAAQLWLGAPPDTATASSPMDVLRHDRRAALTLGVVLCLVITPATTAGFMAGSAVVTIPLTGQSVAGVIAVSNGTISSGVVGAVLGGFLYGRAGAIAFGIASAAISVPIAISATILEVSYTKIMPTQPGLAAGILFALIIGLMAVLSRAWEPSRSPEPGLRCEATCPGASCGSSTTPTDEASCGRRAPFTSSGTNTSRITSPPPANRMLLCDRAPVLHRDRPSAGQQHSDADRICLLPTPAKTAALSTVCGPRRRSS